MRPTSLTALLCTGLAGLLLHGAHAQQGWIPLLSDPYANVFDVDAAYNAWADSARTAVAGRAKNDEGLKRFRKLEKTYLRWRRGAE